MFKESIYIYYSTFAKILTRFKKLMSRSPIYTNMLLLYLIIET